VVVRRGAGGEEVLTIQPHGNNAGDSGFGPYIGTLVFSPDGTRLLTAGRDRRVGGPHGLPGGSVRLWDMQTGEQLQHFAGPRPGVSTSAFVGAAVFNTDGTQVAVGTDGAGGELPEAGEICIWNTTDGSELVRFPMRDEVDPGDFSNSVSALALSPDGTLVASAVGLRPDRADGLILDDGPPTELQLRNIETQETVRTLRGQTSAVSHLVFSPGGEWLATTGGDRLVRLWRTATGELSATYEFDVPAISVLAFSADGRRLAAGGGDDASGQVCVWRRDAQ
jgi:WD40 repeat protein